MYLESSTTQGESPVHKRIIRELSRAEHEKFCLNSRKTKGDHPLRLNTPERPIVNEYREGKVKRTASSRVKRP